MIRFESLETFVKIFFVICLLGLSVAIIIILNTLVTEELYKHSLCFSNQCFKNISGYYSEALNILQITGALSAGIVTIGGFYIALASYINAQDTSKFSNHLANFSLFKGFIESEAVKLDRLSLKTINIFKLYNYIYPNSRTGDLYPSEGYRNFLDLFNSAISASNAQAISAENGSFRYKPHQENIKKILLTIGFELQFMPRNDFHALEGDVIQLLTLVNKEFCFYADLPDIKQRAYS